MPDLEKMGFTLLAQGWTFCEVTGCVWSESGTEQHRFAAFAHHKIHGCPYTAEQQHIDSWLRHHFSRVGFSLADTHREGIFDAPKCDPKDPYCATEAFRNCGQCGACCACRGCIWDQYEKGQTAPYVWDGDYS